MLGFMQEQSCGCVLQKLCSKNSKYSQEKPMLDYVTHIVILRQTAKRIASVK